MCNNKLFIKAQKTDMKGVDSKLIAIFPLNYPYNKLTISLLQLPHEYNKVNDTNVSTDISAFVIEIFERISLLFPVTHLEKIIIHISSHKRHTKHIL